MRNIHELPVITWETWDAQYMTAPSPAILLNQVTFPVSLALVLSCCCPSTFPPDPYHSLTLHTPAQLASCTKLISTWGSASRELTPVLNALPLKSFQAVASGPFGVLVWEELSWSWSWNSSLSELQLGRKNPEVAADLVSCCVKQERMRLRGEKMKEGVTEAAVTAFEIQVLNINRFPTSALVFSAVLLIPSTAPTFPIRLFLS